MGVILGKNPLSRGTLGGSKIDEFGGFEGQNPGFGGQNRDFDDFGTFPWGSIRFWAFLGFFLRNGRAKNRLFGIGHFGTLGGGFEGSKTVSPGHFLRLLRLKIGSILRVQIVTFWGSKTRFFGVEKPCFGGALLGV